MANDLNVAVRVAAAVTGIRDIAALRAEVAKLVSSGGGQVSDPTVRLRDGVSKTTSLVAELKREIGGLASFAGITLAVREVVRAGVEVQRIQNALRAGTGSSAAAAAEFQFITAEARRMGIEVLSAAKSYSALVNATRGTRVEGEATRKIFQGVTTAAVALGLSQEQVGRAFTALSQIAGKGVVSMEEIRGQLAEAIPGAAQIAARALGLTIEQFNALVASGDLTADALLNVLGPALIDEFAPAAEQALQGPQAAFNRMSNSITDLKNAIAQSGIVDALATVAGWVGALAERSRFAVLGIRALGIAQGFLGKSIRDIATFNFDALAANLQTAKDSLKVEAEQLGLITNEAEQEASESASQARDERLRKEAEAKDQVAAIQKDLTAKVRLELQLQLEAYREANQKLSELVDQRNDIAKRFQETRDRIAAGPQKPLEETNVVDVINSIQQAQAQLQGGLGKAADPATALRTVEQARLQIEALAESGNASKQFLDQLAQQAAEVADQAAGSIEEEQRAKVGQLAAEVATSIELINQTAKIEPQVVTAMAIKTAEELRASLERILAANPIVIPVNVAKAGADVLKDTEKKAGGGAVFGPGTSTSDSILVRMSKDEHVLTAAEVAAAGGHPAIYRLRALMRAGKLRGLVPGFAEGGGLSLPAVPKLASSAASAGAGTVNNLYLRLDGRTAGPFTGSDSSMRAVREMIATAALMVGGRR